MNFYVHDYYIGGPTVPSNLDPSSRIFVVCVWEAAVPTDEFLQQFYRLPNPVTLILNSWAKHLPIDARFDTFYIDFCVWRTYNEIVNKGLSSINPAWNAHSNSFLFLTGKPEKRHRINLLYRLEQEGLTDRASVSLFINEENRARCREMLPVDDQEFERFVNRFNGSPDGVRPLPAYSIHYGGIPYDANLFTHKFRLISETTTDLKPAFPSEKTWITVLNQQPFIIAGDHLVCKYLKNLGFSTFDQALITDYDSIVSWPKREQAIVSNVAHWLDTDYDFGPETKHNHARFIMLAHSIVDDWKSYCNRIALDVDIDQVIDTSDPQAI